jgi:hypothetical protein
VERDDGGGSTLFVSLLLPASGWGNKERDDGRKIRVHLARPAD